MKKSGFTLIEVLLTCLLLPLIFVLISAILGFMVNYQFPKLSQNDLFKVQLYQLLSRAKITDCSERLLYTYDKKEYEIKEDRDRIIKTPGYEILMFDVNDVYFEDGNGYCSIFYHYNGIEEVVDIETE